LLLPRCEKKMNAFRHMNLNSALDGLRAVPRKRFFGHFGELGVRAGYSYGDENQNGL